MTSSGIDPNCGSMAAQEAQSRMASWTQQRNAEAQDILELYLHSTLPGSEQVIHLQFDVLDAFLMLFFNRLALLVSAIIVLKYS